MVVSHKNCHDKMEVQSKLINELQATLQKKDEELLEKDKIINMILED